MSNNPKSKWSDFDTYLRPEHLKGQKVTLKIAAVTVEEVYRVGSGKVKMPILHFEQTQKWLPVNVTNQRALLKALGDELETCIGKTVTLEATVINNKDSIKLGVPPQAKVQTAAPSVPKEKPETAG